MDIEGEEEDEIVDEDDVAVELDSIEVVGKKAVVGLVETDRGEAIVDVEDAVSDKEDDVDDENRNTREVSISVEGTDTVENGSAVEIIRTGKALCVPTDLSSARSVVLTSPIP